ncbi:hypothetical protein ACO0RG_001528 [Hanseniaspora osmophila]
MQGAEYFAIIANDKDYPLYEASFTESSTNASAELFPFIANSALDIVEDIQWKTSHDELQQQLQLQQQLMLQQQQGTAASAASAAATSSSTSTMASFFGGGKSSSQTASSGAFGAGSSQVSLGSLYLGCIDHYYQTPISAYITFGNVKFILIHTSNSSVNNNNTRLFYQLVHELYIKTIMNPFYTNGDIIASPMFDAKVRSFAKKYL